MHCCCQNLDLPATLFCDTKPLPPPSALFTMWLSWSSTGNQRPLEGKQSIQHHRHALYVPWSNSQLEIVRMTLHPIKGVINRAGWVLVPLRLLCRRMFVVEEKKHKERLLFLFLWSPNSSRNEIKQTYTVFMSFSRLLLLSFRASTLRCLHILVFIRRPDDFCSAVRRTRRRFILLPTCMHIIARLRKCQLLCLPDRVAALKLPRPMMNDFPRVPFSSSCFGVSVLSERFFPGALQSMHAPGDRWPFSLPSVLIHRWHKRPRRLLRPPVVS